MSERAKRIWIALLLAKLAMVLATCVDLPSLWRADPKATEIDKDD